MDVSRRWGSGFKAFCLTGHLIVEASWIFPSVKVDPLPVAGRQLVVSCGFGVGLQEGYSEAHRMLGSCEPSRVWGLGLGFGV